MKEVIGSSLEDRLVFEDFQISIILEAIKTQRSFCLLRDEYEEMLGPEDSLRALLGRLEKAGLVRFDGTNVQLTIRGELVVRSEETPQPKPVRKIPSWSIGPSKFVLCVEGVEGNGDRLFFDTNLAHHIRILRLCLRDFETALSNDEHDAICDYIEFVKLTYHACDSKNPKFVSEQNPIALLCPFRALINIESLIGRYNFTLFGEYYDLGRSFNVLSEEIIAANIGGLIKLLQAHDVSAKLTFWVRYGP